MKRAKGIKQHDETDCAVACVVWIAQWYGLKLPIIIVRQMCGATVQGTTIKGVLDGCNSVGLDAKAFKSKDKNIDALRKLPKPAILHLETDGGVLHFVVLAAVNHKGFMIMDPAIGSNIIMSEEDLARQWSGYVVLCEPGANFQQGDRTKSALSRIKSVATLYWKQIALSVVSAVMYIGISMSTAVFLQQIVDYVIPGGNVGSVHMVTVIMSVLAFVAFFLGLSRVTNMLTASIGIDYTLVTDYIHHLFALPVSFFTLRGSGELASRVSDAMNIRSFIVTGLSTLMISLLTLLVSFALMFTYYWKMAIIMLMFIPVYCLVYYLSNKVNRRVNRDIIEASAKFEEMTIEGISAISTIKFMCEEDQVTAKIEKQYARLSSMIYKGGRWAGLFASSSDIVSKLLVIVLLCSGALFILKGELTVGELVSFYSMIALFSAPLGELVGLNQSFNEAKISAKRLFEIMDYEAEQENGVDPGESPKPLVFDDVKFSYPGNHSLIEHFSESFMPGQITALVGESGCGKSSVASLIMRGYQPLGGSISLDGINISMFGLKQWRNYVALVPQECILLNATILENITGGSKEPDLERVAKLLVELDMQNFLSTLPLGIMTKVGERGATLSGGQKQRIALARALYKRPKILIMDEATSSLDVSSEKFILSKIETLAKGGLTVVMITHKTDNIKIAGKIINMSARSKGEVCTP